MDDEYQNADPMAVSRLDVISCGLGGAVLLGLVFSIVRHEPPVEVSSPPFILVEWTVESKNTNVYPLINPVVQPPGGANAFDINIDDFNPWSGKPKPINQRVDVASPLEQYGLFTILGFSRFGEEGLRRASNGNPILHSNDSSQTTYQLKITNPSPGKWGFKARFQNIRNADDVDDVSITSMIDVTTRIYTRTSRDAIEVKNTDIQFGFTNQDFVQIEIPAD